MRLFRRRQDVPAAEPPAGEPTEDGQDVARPEQAPTGDWMTLAPLAPTVRPPAPTFRVQTLPEILPSHQAIRLSGNLGHSISPQAPSGVVEGMAVTNPGVHPVVGHGDLPLRAPHSPEPASAPLNVRRLATTEAPAPIAGPALPEPAVSRVLANPTPLSPPAIAPLPVARVVDPAPPPASAQAPAGPPDGEASSGTVEGEAEPAGAPLVGDDRVGGFAADLAELTAPAAGSGILRPAPAELAPAIQPRTLQRRHDPRRAPVQRAAEAPRGAPPMAAASPETPAPVTASGEAAGGAVGTDSGRAASTDSGRAASTDTGRAASTDSGPAPSADSGPATGTDSGLAAGADDDRAAEPVALQTSPLLGEPAPHAETAPALAEPAPSSDLVLRQPAAPAASPLPDDQAAGGLPEEPEVVVPAPAAETPPPEAAVPEAPASEAPLPEAPLLGAGAPSTTSAMSTTTAPEPPSPAATGPAAAPAAIGPHLTLHGSSSTPMAPAGGGVRPAQVQRQADGPLPDPSSGEPSPAGGQGDEAPGQTRAGEGPAAETPTRIPAAPDGAVAPTLGIGAAELALTAEDQPSGIAGLSEGPAAAATTAVSRLPLAPAEQPGALAAPGPGYPRAAPSDRVLSHPLAAPGHSSMSSSGPTSPPAGPLQRSPEASAQGAGQESTGTAAPLVTTLQRQAAMPGVGGIFSSSPLAHPLSLPRQRATSAALMTPASAMAGPAGATGLDGGDRMTMVHRLEAGPGSSGGSSPSAGLSRPSEALPLHTPAAGAPTAADIVVRAGLAERQDDGTLLYTSPPGGQATEAVVQRRLGDPPAPPTAAEVPPPAVEPAPQAAEAQPGGEASGAAAQSPEELDLLARRLYKRLRSEMQTDIARQLEAKNRAGRYRR